MSTMEPMTIEEIKQEIRTLANGVSCGESCDRFTRRLVLAWIHAEARARRSEHSVGCQTYESCSICRQPRSYWLAQIKAEVGWPRQSE